MQQACFELQIVIRSL